MDFFNFCLASCLPSAKDFFILKKNRVLNLQFLQKEKAFPGLSQGFWQRKQNLDFKKLEQDFALTKKAKKYELLRLDQNQYPKNLKEISDPPVYLFIWGNKKILGKPALSFVGSRRATNYGRKVVNYLILNLQFDWVIVSGLALGIDSFSHQAALDSNKKTIAVLGSGFFNLYPSIHQKLAEKIVKSKGIVISEYPPQFKPEKYYFPARNRIIAGLSLATIIVEAAKHSGSLITASLAAKYGREVMAVPADLFCLTSVGCFSLIKQGAKPIFNSEDIEEGFFILNQNWQKKDKRGEKDPLLEFLSAPKHIEEIQKFMGLTLKKSLVKLAKLEMENKIKNLGRGFYQTK